MNFCPACGLDLRKIQGVIEEEGIHIPSVWAETETTFPDSITITDGTSWTVGSSYKIIVT